MAALVLMSASCARRPATPGVQRLAILRFENLSGDPSLDWMGRAFAETITAELAGSSTLYAIPSTRLHSLNQALGIRPISAPGISAEAPLAQALRATRIGYGYYWVQSGVVQAHLTIEDLRTRRMVQSLTSATARVPDVLPAANSLAHGISSDAQTWTARNPEALRLYSTALESTDAAAMEREAQAAIAADPDFSRPYLLLAELRARRQDRTGAQDALQSALGRQGIDTAERAEIESTAAGLRNDPVGREHALTTLARLSPNDPATWRSLAELEQTRRRFAESFQAYQRALAVDPEDVTTWNESAYAAAYGGNLTAAMAALRRYQALRPGDANPLDSMGDVNLLLGRLAEAERFYLEADKKDPTFLNGAEHYKAAMARLMTGDVAGADSIFQQRLPQPNPQWLWATGRRQEAYQLLQQQLQAAAKSPALSAGYSELALWSLWRNDRAAAAQAAQEAIGTATQASANLAVLMRFLTQPEAPADEWAARARQAFANPAARDLATAYALLRAREFEPAAALLRQIYESNPVPPDASLPIELAWALVEMGNLKDAEPLLRWNPLPEASGPGVFLPFYFPRVFELRARVWEKTDPQRAAAARKVFEALSGARL